MKVSFSRLEFKHHQNFDLFYYEVRRLTELVEGFKEEVKSLWSVRERVLTLEREIRVFRHEMNQTVVNVEAHEEKINGLMGIEVESDEQGSEESDIEVGSDELGSEESEISGLANDLINE